MTGEATDVHHCTRRPATAADDGFLHDLYASTRTDLDDLGLTEETRASLVELQWRAQRNGYAASYPDAHDQVIELDGRPAGRILLGKVGTDVVIVDFALLPECRGHGIGGRVLHEVLRDAAGAGHGVRLEVEDGNPARRLFERAGFVVAGTSGIRYEMRWPS